MLKLSRLVSPKIETFQENFEVIFHVSKSLCDQKLPDFFIKKMSAKASWMFLLFPLIGCGGGKSTNSDSPLSNDISGRAIDGYLVGADVALLNNPDSRTVTSDVNGRQGVFDSLYGTGTILVSGGVDISTGKPFIGQLMAPADSKVVTPLTTLVSSVFENDIAKYNNLVNNYANEFEGPEVIVKNLAIGLGLRDETDLLNTDFISEGLAGQFKAAAQVSNVILLATAVSDHQSALSLITNLANNTYPII